MPPGAASRSSMRASTTDPAFTLRSRWSGAGIHNGNVRRRVGTIERRAARRIFLACLGALTRARCVAFFPLRRAFLSSLGASSRKRSHTAHFSIRIAQPTSTTAYLASLRSLAGHATERTHAPEITTSLRPAGKRRRHPDRGPGRAPIASSFTSLSCVIAAPIRTPAWVAAATISCCLYGSIRG